MTHEKKFESRHFSGYKLDTSQKYYCATIFYGPLLVRVYVVLCMSVILSEVKRNRRIAYRKSYSTLPSSIDLDNKFVKLFDYDTNYITTREKIMG